MSLITYMKETALYAACAVLLVLVTDLVLLTGGALNGGKQDFIYLNVLLGTTILLFWALGYVKFKGRYMKLRQALDKGECMDDLLPGDGGFYSALLRDTVRFKNNEHSDKIALYQSNMDELNDYITKWVHEIKMPVSVCELILENGDLGRADTSRSLKIELERTKFLINQVLYAGRAAHYNEDLSTAEFSLGKAVKEAVKRSAQFFISKNIEVTLDLPDVGIVNDEKWVSYILDQILNNAAKYTRNDGKVEIAAREDEKAVRLHIRDNGIGIVTQDIPRVFDKGFTGENGRKTTKSTGMGMYYSRKMADRLGLGLEVSSKVGEYTEFVLVFYKMSDYLRVT